MASSRLSHLEKLPLRNEILEITVLPDVGAKLLDLTYIPTSQNFLWHNPRIEPQTYPIESNFDNYWCGGWDDGFPTCEACVHNGENYPNLGELRSLSWKIDGDHSLSYVKLSAKGPISPVEAQKEVRLLGSTLEVRFAVRHVGYEPLNFIWGTHPAYAITPDCVLHIPARKGCVGQSGQLYKWPLLETSDGVLDMSRALAPGKFSAGHYAMELDAGWYAVEYPNRQSGLLFEFPLDICPYLWLWLSYGGWRGYYVAVVEPWTSCPVTLTEAVAANTHRILEPGGSFSCTVRATPWSKPSTLQTLLETKGIK
jgi:hypothetical protein